MAKIISEEQQLHFYNYEKYYKHAVDEKNSGRFTESITTELIEMGADKEAASRIMENMDQYKKHSGYGKNGCKRLAIAIPLTLVVLAKLVHLLLKSS